MSQEETEQPYEFIFSYALSLCQNPLMGPGIQAYDVRQSEAHVCPRGQERLPGNTATVNSFPILGCFSFSVFNFIKIFIPT